LNYKVLGLKDVFVIIPLAVVGLTFRVMHSGGWENSFISFNGRENDALMLISAEGKT
jgi:hypothetical protein